MTSHVTSYYFVIVLKTVNIKEDKDLNCLYQLNSVSNWRCTLLNGVVSSYFYFIYIDFNWLWTLKIEVGFDVWFDFEQWAGMQVGLMWKPLFPQIHRDTDTCTSNRDLQLLINLAKTLFVVKFDQRGKDIHISGRRFRKHAGIFTWKAKLALSLSWNFLKNRKAMAHGPSLY